MSHFVTLVLIDKDAADQEAAFNQLLEPYWEELKVPEYTVKCGCVGGVADKEVEEKIIEDFGTIEEARANFFERHRDIADDKNKADEVEALWRKEVRDPRERQRTKLFEEHPMKDVAQADCTECSGIGQRLSTYNPKSKWDWVQVGGRWHGLLEPLHSELNTWDEDVIPVKDLLEASPEEFKTKVVPFALVTPDGTWHERGEMGWWAMTRNEMPKGEWEEIVRALLQENADKLAILADCHI